MVGDAGVAAVARPAQMGGDALALQEDLDGAGGQAHLDRGAGMAIWHRVEMPLDLDMIVEPHLAATPLRQDVRLGRQGLEMRGVKFLEQLPARAAEPAHDPVVELRHQVGDGGVQIADAVPDPVAQPPQQPALDDANARFHLGFIAGAVRSRRQHRCAVVCRHLGVGPVDLRVVQARLDDRDGTVRISVCGRAVEHYAAMARMKRSPKMTANWALAMDHSRGGIFHSFSDRFKIR